MTRATGAGGQAPLLLGLLGRGARAARAVGLEPAFAVTRDAADRAFRRAERPPLRARTDGFVLHGYLRHRSFLAEVAAGTPGGYRGLFRGSVAPGATVCDGGAHIGLYTVLGSRLAGPTGRVLAFEPDSYNLPALRWNARTSGVGNVRVVPKALADAPGRAAFHENSGTISSSLAERGVGSELTREVEVTSLDHELAGAPLELLVVKLNIEGAELRALLGMRESLERAAAVRLFAELNTKALSAVGVEPREVLARLRGHGLSVQRIDARDESLSDLSDDDLPEKCHVFCARG